MHDVLGERFDKYYDFCGVGKNFFSQLTVYVITILFITATVFERCVKEDSVSSTYILTSKASFRSVLTDSSSVF